MHLSSKSLIVFLTSMVVVANTLTLSIFAAEKRSNSSNKNSSSQLLIKPNSAKVITLSKSGHYQLIGSKQNNISSDNNVVFVNKNDHIVVKGGGVYDIVLENVNINLNNVNKFCPFSIEKKSTVNLTLVGENTLTSNSNDGLHISEYSTLNITKESQGSSLNVVGSENGISGSSTTIDGGNIDASGNNCGIYTDGVTINDGDITASGDCYGINTLNITSNGGIIKASGNQSGIHAESTSMSDGMISASGKNNGMCCSEIIIKGGDITASGKDFGILGSNITIEGDNITANGGKYGICAYDLTVTSGNISTSNIHLSNNIAMSGGDISGINTYADTKIYLENIDNIDISGGTINGIAYPSDQPEALSVFVEHPAETSFDKEMFNDESAESPKSTEAIPTTGSAVEDHLPLIYLCMGLVFVTSVFINHRKLV